ncbi:MAG: EpsI family protein [Alphaproteobacteria bacterium]|nr:EpsI family protein [Alphaproteobacteria bacterium]
MAAIVTDMPFASRLAVTPMVCFGAIVAAAVALWAPTALDMATLWAMSSSYHYGIFVAPIAVWMVAAKSAHAPAPTNRLPGFFIIAIGAALWLLGRAGGVALVEQFALVTTIIGGVGVAFGGGALRAWAYPLAFLYFMVPFGEAIVPGLQTITAQIIVALLGALSMPVTIDGYLIQTPAGAFEVAEACAGFRFLISATMIAAVFAYVAFQSWRKRIGFLLFAIAFAILANGVRAFLLVLIATLTDMQWAVGPDHLLIGWMFYALLFVVLIAAGRRYADKAAPQPSAQAHPAGANAMPAMLAAIAIIAGAAIYANAVVERPVHKAAPVSLSLLNAPGWRILPPAQNWRAELQQADRTAGATYVSGDNTVYLSLGYFTHDRKGGEIINYKNRAWSGAYWRHIGVRDAVIYLFGTSKTRRIDILAAPERRRLAAVTVYWLGDEIFVEPWRMKIAQAKAKLTGRNPSGGLIIIAASYNRDPAEAVAALRNFTGDLEPLSAWLSRIDRQ